MSKYETFDDLGKAINQLSDNAQENDRYWQLKREAQALTGRSTKAHNDLLELGIQAYAAGLKPVHLHVAAQALNYGGYFQLGNADNKPKPVDKYEAGKQAARELKFMLAKDKADQWDWLVDHVSNYPIHYFN